MSQTERGLIHFKPEAVLLNHGFVDSSVIVNTETGLIEAVGSESNLRQNFDFEQINQSIEGGRLLPAFTDAHDHVLPDAYSLIMQDPRVEDYTDKKSLLAKLKMDYKRRIDQGYQGHIIARGLDSRITLDSHDLDLIAPNLPLAVLDPSNHGGVLNSLSASIVQEILVRSPEKPSGHLTKSGHASEGHLTLAKEAAIAAIPDEAVIEALEQVLHRRESHGTIAVHDMGLRNRRELELLMTVKKHWEKTYEVPFMITRAYLFPSLFSPDPAAEIEACLKSKTISPQDLSWIGIKLFADGSFGARSAHLSENYNDEPGNFGQATGEAEKMLEMLEEGAKLGVCEVAVHAIGDAAIQNTLLVAKKWKSIAEQHAIDPTRFRIEHFELPIPIKETLDEAKRLDLWVTAQPNFLTDYYYRDRLGDRVKQINPHRELHEKNINMMFGTDRMPASPLFAIWCAMQALFETQQLTFEEALHYFSSTPAEFEKEIRGNIGPGQRADLMLVDPNLTEMMPSPSDLLHRRLKRESCHEELQERQMQLQGSIRNVYLEGKSIYTRHNP